MHHPLMDMSSFTNSQLIEKIAITSSRVMAVRSSGQSYDIIEQLRQVMMACQDELSERSREAVVNEPVAWDMDSYLEQNKQTINRDKEQENQPRWKTKALSQLNNETDSDSDSPWG